MNGYQSTWQDIVFGAPQGSILGPLLFLLYINHLPLVCQSVDVILFTDDTNVTAISKTKQEVDADLERLNHWLFANKLILNLSKKIQLNIKPSAST